MATPASTSASHTTFHLFPNLPWELRARVWELTISPRTVPLKRRFRRVSLCTFSDDTLRVLDTVYGGRWKHHTTLNLLFTSSPIPAPLHACQEARNHLTHPACGANGYGYYEKMSTSDLENGQQPWLWEEKIRSTYIWVNFEVDMIDIGVDRFRLPGTSSYASKFRRVKFTPSLGPGNFVGTFECVTPGRDTSKWPSWRSPFMSFPLVKEAEVNVPWPASVAEWADHLP